LTFGHALNTRSRAHSQRFGQNADWMDAAKALDLWIRTGPKPG